MISISDNGSGIEPKYLSQIFEPFFTTKKSGQSMGLGLSTALGIIKNHSGDLAVESVPKMGSRFTITLPC